MAPTSAVLPRRPRLSDGSVPSAPPSAEHARLAEVSGTSGPWRLWGPYLSGRQWGTVREDYSEDGNAWASFPFDQAHARAYRWVTTDSAGSATDSAS